MDTILAAIKKDAVNIFTEETLTEKLRSGRKLIIKLGADPNRPDLHLGHTVVLRKLKLFQELGHSVVFVIGDFTGMIGDPSGKSKARPALTIEETRKSGQSYFEQVTKILDPEKTRIEYNSTWLSRMNFEDVIKLASKYTLARMLERDDFKNRYQNEAPISLHELLYPLVQGYDSVALNADIEIGGTDQTFNLLVGRNLQSHYNQEPQVVMTFPLLVGLDGKEKMSKSLDNYIGISEPANIMFEKCMKVPDDLMLDYFVLTTDITKDEAQQILGGDIRSAHFEYARIITTMYHDADSARKAKERYMQLAKGTTPDDIKTLTFDDDSADIITLLKFAGFAQSSSEARRQVTGNGVKINGEVVKDVYMQVDISDGVVLQFGKNRIIKIVNKE
jgi:tyrosyl-tRNA synthetase